MQQTGTCACATQCQPGELDGVVHDSPAMLQQKVQKAAQGNKLMMVINSLVLVSFRPHPAQRWVYLLQATCTGAATRWHLV